MEKYRVAIVGATSLVGQELIKVLEQHNFPMSELHLYDLNRPANKKMYVAHRQMEVKETSNDSFQETDIAFFSAGADVSRHFAPIAVQSGALVVDNSPVFRMMSRVPMVIPEVNPKDIKRQHRIIASPTCTTTLIVMALYPLHKVNPIKRILISTFQSTSGMGTPAMEELTLQSKQVLEGDAAVPHVFPHQIAFNLLPEVDVFLDNGYTKEEWNLADETRKILHKEDIMISATCVRVPVFIGHSAAIHVELSKIMTADEARSILVEAPGIKVLDDPTVNLYPQPWSAAGTDEVHIGRIRQDASHPTGLAMWVAADNLRKGASVNMVQIAEEMIQRDWIKPRVKR